MSGYSAGSASVTTAATLITSGPSNPDSDGQLVRTTSSASVYLGNSTVTSTTGFPISSTDGVVHVPVTGSETQALYGVVASGTATVYYIGPQ
jgi:hypothetical protein